MPREREGAPDSASAQTHRAAQRPRGRGGSPDELRKSADRARRAEIALVSGYLRALRRLGEVPLTAPRPQMPH